MKLLERLYEVKQMDPGWEHYRAMCDVFPALIQVVEQQREALEVASKALNAFGIGTEEIANVCAMSAEEFSLFLEGCKSLDADAADKVRAALALLDKEDGNG